MRDKLLLVLSSGGLLFSGYLSGMKLFGDTCAFGESCPTFLGYPTCYYGFVVFLLLFVLSLLLALGRMEWGRASRATLFVATLGVLFSGYFTFGELGKIVDEGIRAYMLGLPTCAYGFLFYAIIAVTSSLMIRRGK